MLNLIFDIIFPQTRCAICRRPGRFGTRTPWCAECTDNMERLRYQLPICDKCGKYIESESGLCSDCKERMPAFEISRATGPYTDLYRIAIKVLKFIGKKNLAYRMGCMMAKVVKEEKRFWPIDLVVPVPSSQGSLKQRGFSQTDLLARQVAKKLKLKVGVNLLVRVKDTPTQRELTREEREKNLQSAFDIKDRKKVQGKSILLVDDVYTTGSTIRECTRILLEAGAARVSVITWATGIAY
ncbi:MAG: ComF family protein [Syntrophomonadaceae bacterium]